MTLDIILTGAFTIASYYAYVFLKNMPTDK